MKPSTIFYGVLAIVTFWTVIGGIVFGWVALTTYRNPRHSTGAITYGFTVVLVGAIVFFAAILMLSAAWYG